MSLVELVTSILKQLPNRPCLSINHNEVLELLHTTLKPSLLETIKISESKKIFQPTSALPSIPCSYWTGFGRGGAEMASPAAGGWNPGILRANSSYTAV